MPLSERTGFGSISRWWPGNIRRSAFRTTRSSASRATISRASMVPSSKRLRAARAGASSTTTGSARRVGSTSPSHTNSAIFCCGEQDVVRWDSEYGQVEHQANVFAANFLMPLDDFRRQIAPNAKVDLDMISHCADRYRVSLIAATLRWLSYTQKRAVLVVSRDG